MTKKVEDILEDLEIKAVEATIPNDIETLQKEILRLRKILETYGIQEEAHISNIEYVCQIGIDNLKKLAMHGALDSDATKTLDLLHKNLRMARGSLTKKEKPEKSATEAELLRIVNGTKE